MMATTAPLCLEDLATRKLVLDLLEALGVTGDAAQAIARETAVARHAKRVEMAEQAAIVAAQSLCLEAENQENYVEDRVRALGALLCHLDAAGIGGRDGVEGAATIRIPAFEGLGKGRKQATDGGAWTAAIAEAARRLLPNGRVYTHPEAAGLGIRTPSGDISAFLDMAKIQETGLTAWVLTLAREGLRVSLGLEPWIWKGYGESPLGQSEPAEWARLVNACSEEQEPSRY